VYEFEHVLEVGDVAILIKSLVLSLETWLFLPVCTAPHTELQTELLFAIPLGFLDIITLFA
jgi:hypothetical protein